MSEVKVEDSILLSIKKSLGLEPSMNHFDADIMMCINSAFNILTQLGVGPVEGYEITSEEDLWVDFIGHDKRLNMVKTYIFLKTKLTFDPPTVGALMSSYKEQVQEYEYRLNYQVDPKDTFNRDEDWG